MALAQAEYAQVAIKYVADTFASGLGAIESACKENGQGGKDNFLGQKVKPKELWPWMGSTAAAISGSHLSFLQGISHQTRAAGGSKPFMYGPGMVNIIANGSPLRRPF
jgi:hypothetical protein